MARTPSAAKKAAREALTVGGLIDRYLADGPAAKLAKRASTWKIDAANLNRHVRPILGNKVANVVTKADATRAIRDIALGKTAIDEKTRPRGRARVTGGEATARRTAAVASAMFAWGTEHGFVATNPFAGIKLNRAPVRERFLSKDEAGRFLDAIADLQDKSLLSETFADALRLLLLTGARKTEILGLRWSEVDQLRNVLILPPERTKAGGKIGERRISLSMPALEILSRRRARSDAEMPATGKLVRFSRGARRRSRYRAAAGVHEGTRQGKSRGTENSRPAAFVRQFRRRGRGQLIPHWQAARTRERPHNRAIRPLVQRSSSGRGEPSRPQDHGRDETGRRSRSTCDGRRSATHDSVMADRPGIERLLDLLRDGLVEANRLFQAGEHGGREGADSRVRNMS